MSHGIDTPLRVEKLDDGKRWRVLERFVYAVDGDNALIVDAEDVILMQDGRFVDVPAGFITDFASVPRFFWRIANPVGKVGKPAVIHDKLYRAPVLLKVEGSAIVPTAITRKEADVIFLEAMEHVGMNWIERKLFYYGVRLGGRWSFNP